MWVCVGSGQVCVCVCVCGRLFFFMSLWHLLQRDTLESRASKYYTGLFCLGVCVHL